MYAERMPIINQGIDEGTVTYYVSPNGTKSIVPTSYLNQNNAIASKITEATIITIDPKAIKPTIDEVLSSAVVVKTKAVASVKPIVKNESDLPKTVKADTNPPVELIDQPQQSVAPSIQKNSIEDFIQKNPKYVTYGLVALLSGLTIAYIKK